MQTETEVRFLEINKPVLVSKLKELGAEDKGEQMLEEVIIYDPALNWLKEKRFIRLRKLGENTTLTYKEHSQDPKLPARELEFAVGHLENAAALFEKIGLLPYRRQQKLRHTLRLGDVTFDFDTWPRVPAYVELEGPSIEALQNAAATLGLSWEEAVYDDAKKVLETRYNIPMGTLRWFTFDRVE